MITTKRFLAAIVLVLGVSCCAAFAQRGGVYVDAIQIKNDGKVVFSDNFDDGNISDWYQLTDVSLVPTGQKPPSQMLWMNNHGKLTGMAHHKLNLDNVGTVEFAATVFVAPAADQYEWQKDRFSAFFMALEYRETPNSPADSVRIDVILYPKDQSCKVAAKRNSPKVDKFSPSAQPVLPTGKWAYLTLRLDPMSQTATVFVDKSPVASIPYDPADFPAFNNLVLSSSFGDGAQMPQ